MDFTIYRAREDDLVKGCKRGDHHAQQRLFDLYSGRMYGVCSRYVKNTMQAEDILVMGFTKVFEKISQFKGEGSFEGWVRRIMVNESLSYLRKTRTMVIETDLEKADREPDYDRLSDHLEAQDLLKMIEQLPAGYRIVFNMYAIDGYCHKEIAEALGISENTSKSQLSRARLYLQKLLAQTDCHLNQKFGNHESAT
jgi:RNA polymerase sigma factor (sigma-70 family)